LQRIFLCNLKIVHHDDDDEQKKKIGRSDDLNRADDIDMILQPKQTPTFFQQTVHAETMPFQLDQFIPASFEPGFNALVVGERFSGTTTLIKHFLEPLKGSGAIIVAMSPSATERDMYMEVTDRAMVSDYDRKRLIGIVEMQKFRKEIKDAKIDHVVIVIDTIWSEHIRRDAVIADLLMNSYWYGISVILHVQDVREVPLSLVGNLTKCVFSPRAMKETDLVKRIAKKWCLTEEMTQAIAVFGDKIAGVDRAFMVLGQIDARSKPKFIGWAKAYAKDDEDQMMLDHLQIYGIGIRTTGNDETPSAD
jgi:hypothetical protein